MDDLEERNIVILEFRKVVEKKKLIIIESVYEEKSNDVQNLVKKMIFVDDDSKLYFKVFIFFLLFKSLDVDKKFIGIKLKDKFIE